MKRRVRHFVVMKISYILCQIRNNKKRESQGILRIPR
jgi:hypothetical protein